MQKHMLLQKVMLIVVVSTILVLSLAGMKDTGAATLSPGDIVVDDGERTIIQIDGETGDQTVITTQGVLNIVQVLAIDAAGQILVVDVCVQAVAPGVVRINPATATQTIISMGGLFGDHCMGRPALIAIAPDGQILVAGSFTAGTNFNQVI
jgi:hypothetical protein